jgi:hypothetical protein
VRSSNAAADGLIGGDVVLAMEDKEMQEKEEEGEEDKETMHATARDLYLSHRSRDDGRCTRGHGGIR